MDFSNRNFATVGNYSFAPDRYEKGWRRMNCPKCNDSDTDVIDTRPMPYGVRRRRECLACDHRWSTVEINYTQYKKYNEIAKLLEIIAKEPEKGE